MVSKPSPALAMGLAGAIASGFMASDFIASGAMADWARAVPAATAVPRAATAIRVRSLVMGLRLSWVERTGAR